MPKIPRTCTVCGAVFVRHVTVTEENKGWGRFCSKSCSASAQKKKHGHYSGDKPSRTYITWQSMRQRCRDAGSDGFYAYGAKGISVCDDWLHSFDKFVEDMGERPKGCTLDRIDPSGPYTKENCRWATAKEQASNRRNNRLVQFSGEILTAAEAARRAGISKTVLCSRIKKGWPEELWFIINPSRKAPSRLTASE